MEKSTVAKHVQLLHNPKAGDGDYVKGELMAAITSCGFTCKYMSTKERGWTRFRRKTALVIIAGGDGTVRKVMKRLLARKLLDKRLVISLLPAGTANNFATALGIDASVPTLCKTIMGGRLAKIDVGAVSNVRDAKFFLEGMGCGMFPRLIKVMRDNPLSGEETAEEELNIARDRLIQIAKNYKAKYAEITVDGVLHVGTYLLVEILNIKSVGPNLILAPHASPTDGKFQVVLVSEEQREAFVDYLNKLKSGHAPAQRAKVPWQVIETSREIILRGDNRMIHVDDELINVKQRRPIRVEVRPGIMDVLV